MPAEYQLQHGGGVLRIADGAFIPPDPRNTDYRAFLAWRDEGNTPDPPPEPESPAVHNQGE